MAILELINKNKPSDIGVEVSTEQLAEKAVRMRKIFNDILRSIDVIEKCVNDSNYYWLSDSAETVRNLFKEDKADFADVKNNIMLSVENLNQIISLYDSTEKESVMEASNLPSGIID